MRRAKLYYLRDRKGKSARISEKIKKKIGLDVSEQVTINQPKAKEEVKEETVKAEASRSESNKEEKINPNQGKKKKELQTKKK